MFKKDGGEKKVEEKKEEVEKKEFKPPEKVVKADAKYSQYETLNEVDKGIFNNDGENERKADEYFLRSLSAEFQGTRHSEALFFLKKKEFRKLANRLRLAEKVFDILTRNVFKELQCIVINIIWNRRFITTAGKAVLSRKKELTIHLSPSICIEAERIRDVMSHELCHAMSFLVDRQGGHSTHWKKWGTALAEYFPSLPHIATTHNYEIYKRFKMECQECDLVIKRQNRWKTCKFCDKELIVYRFNSESRKYSLVDEESGKRRKNSRWVKHFAKGMKENGGKELPQTMIMGKIKSTFERPPSTVPEARTSSTMKLINKEEQQEAAGSSSTHKLTNGVAEMLKTTISATAENSGIAENCENTRATKESTPISS